MAVIRTDNLTIPQGVTWAIRWPLLDISGDPLDTTGWSAKAQIRSKASSVEVLHEWSTVAGNAEFVDGALELRLEPEDSEDWTAWRSLTAVYDVKLTSGEGTVARLVQGTIKVIEAVTREVVVVPGE